MDCYTKLSPTTTADINSDLLKICQNDTPWNVPQVGTLLYKVPDKELIYRDPFLKYICENHMKDNYSLNVNLFKLRAWSHYILHTDQFRSASLNLLVNSEADSISYFKTSELEKGQYSIKELKYDPLSFYLFNSKIPHAMTNRDSDRYLLSISLKHDYPTMKGLLADYIFLNSSGNTLM